MDPQLVTAVSAVEAEGIDAAVVGLIVAASSAVTAIAGWIGRQGWDKRKAAQNGSHALPGGVPPQPAPQVEEKAVEVEADLKEHLRDCKEERRETREEFRRLYERMDQVAGDVRYIKGRLDGPPQRGQQP